MNTLLWFDVGIKRYTTKNYRGVQEGSCGLMQESKDIQQKNVNNNTTNSCGLMQESKDIQRHGAGTEPMGVVV